MNYYFYNYNKIILKKIKKKILNTLLKLKKKKK